MQCMNGTVSEVTSPVRTTGTLGLMIDTDWSILCPPGFHLVLILMRVTIFSFIFFRQVGIEIKDFGQSWRSGVAFHSIIHAIRPDLVDMEKVKGRSNRENLEEAFTLAETELGIPRLLDPEGI